MSGAHSSNIPPMAAPSAFMMRMAVLLDFVSQNIFDGFCAEYTSFFSDHAKNPAAGAVRPPQVFKKEKNSMV